MHARLLGARRRDRQAGRARRLASAAPRPPAAASSTCIADAARRIGLQLAGARVAVQGFGNVGGGGAAARTRPARRSSPSATRRRRPPIADGLDIPFAADATCEDTARSPGLPAPSRSRTTSCSGSTCDILVPAALEGQITAANAGTRPGADPGRGRERPDHARGRRDPRARGIFVIPDILCNAGGVIVSYFEWVQDRERLAWTPDEIASRLERDDAGGGRRGSGGWRPRARSTPDWRPKSWPSIGSPRRPRFVEAGRSVGA